LGIFKSSQTHVAASDRLTAPDDRRTHSGNRIKRYRTVYLRAVLKRYSGLRRCFKKVPGAKSVLLKSTADAQEIYILSCFDHFVGGHL
jgi:hypothetical protein